MNKLFLDIIHAPEYFSFYELIHTDTGLNNVPEYLVDIRTLGLCSRVLNYIRHQVGFPISVNSGYRSTDVNRAVGGAVHSHHLCGRAFDIRPSSKSKVRYEQLLDVLQSASLSEFFDEVIPYADKGFVHISINMQTIYDNVLSMVDDKTFRYNILDIL